MIVSALTLTPIKDRIELAPELLKKIETPKINKINASVLTCEYLANGKVSTKILQLHSEFKQLYL